VGKRSDDAAVDSPEPTGAVRHDKPGQPVYQAAEEPRAAQAHHRLLIAAGLEEPRSHDQVDVSPFQFLHKPLHLTGPVLPVPVNLHGDVIPVQGSVPVSCLHRAPDAEVERQGDYCRPWRDLTNRIVRGCVVNYDDIEPGQGTPQLLHHPAHGSPFVERRHDDQALQR
jgi:hypothetical protein